MRTLHVSLRVADPDRSLAFYRALGYEVVGRVADTPQGDLTMIKLPDDEFVTIELVHDPDHREPGTGSALSCFVIAVESMDATVAALATRGIEAEAPTSPDGRPRLPDDVDRRSRRQPDRARAVAARARRRDERRRLARTDPTRRSTR